MQIRSAFANRLCRRRIERPLPDRVVLGGRSSDQADERHTRADRQRYVGGILDVRIEHDEHRMVVVSNPQRPRTGHRAYDHVLERSASSNRIVGQDFRELRQWIERLDSYRSAT